MMPTNHGYTRAIHFTETYHSSLDINKWYTFKVHKSYTQGAQVSTAQWDTRYTGLLHVSKFRQNLCYRI